LIGVGRFFFFALLGFSFGAGGALGNLFFVSDADFQELSCNESDYDVNYREYKREDDCCGKIRISESYKKHKAENVASGMREACGGSIHYICAQDSASDTHYEREYEYEQKAFRFDERRGVAREKCSDQHEHGRDHGIIYRTEKEKVFKKFLYVHNKRSLRKVVHINFIII